MSIKIIIRQGLDQDYTWQQIQDGVAASVQQGSIADLAESIGIGKVDCYFIVSGIEAIYQRIGFTDAERKHLSKTIPYTLEDSLLSDIEDLHLQIAKPQAHDVAVSALPHDRMAEIVEAFAQSGIRLSGVFAEQALIATVLRDNIKPSLYFDGQCFTVLDVDHSIVTVETEILPIVLASMTDQFAALPLSMELILADKSLEEQALVAIPEALRHLLSVSDVDYFTLMAPACERKQTLNLLAGKYSPSTEWAGLWKQWRAVAVLAAVAIAVELTLAFVGNSRLASQELAQRKQMEQIYRQVSPRGKVVNPQSQLKSELKRLQGGGQQQAMMVLLERVGSVVQEAEGLEMNAINYESGGRELRFDVLVANFQQIEKIKTGVESQGLNYELLNSNAQGEKLRARIVVSGVING